MRRSPHARTYREAIPAYVLFGENVAALPGDYYIEPLRDRSERHNWEIAPHRHFGLLQIFILSAGQVTATVDGLMVAGKAPLVLTIPAAAPHAMRYVPHSEGYVLTLLGLSHPLFDMAAAAPLIDQLFLRPQKIDLGQDPHTMDRLLGLIVQLQEEHARQEAHDGFLSMTLIAAVLAMLARTRDPRATNISEDHTSQARFREFESLVSQHFTEHRSVASYARDLKLSESQLDRICRASVGRTAFQVIQSRLVLESRRLLHYSTRPISMIADDLGFADQAYFSRFIRKHTGSPPSALR